MYNQPTIRLPNGRMQGTLYKNPIDCLWKTVQAEGIFGWYKGPSVPHPCRCIFNVIFSPPQVQLHISYGSLLIREPRDFFCPCHNWWPWAALESSHSLRTTWFLTYIKASGIEINDIPEPIDVWICVIIPSLLRGQTVCWKLESDHAVYIYI